jgi:hypothetical protein
MMLQMEMQSVERLHFTMIKEYHSGINYFETYTDSPISNYTYVSLHLGKFFGSIYLRWQQPPTEQEIIDNATLVLKGKGVSEENINQLIEKKKLINATDIIGSMHQSNNEVNSMVINFLK